MHPETGGVFSRSGTPGTVDLTKAEFGVLKKGISEETLRGAASKQLDGLMKAGNKGVGASSMEKISKILERIKLQTDRND